MTTTLPPIKEEDFEDALALVPKEIQDFMFSDAFDYILEVAQKTLSLTGPERESMKTAAYDLLLQLTTMEDEAKELLAQGIAPEKVTKILYVIDTQILTAAQNLMRYQDEVVADEKALGIDEYETSPTESPATISMTGIAQTLTKPTTFAPTKREVDTSAPSAPQKEASKIDPYRELPEV